MKQRIEYIPLGLLFLLWGFTTVHFSDLPETLPIHFDALGKPDDFGPRSYAFGLPIVASILYGLLFLVGKRKKVPTKDKYVLLWIQSLIVLIFSYIQVQSFLVALRRSNGLGSWFLPLFVGLLLFPLLLNHLMKKK